MIKKLLLLISILPVFAFSFAPAAYADTTKCAIQKGVNLTANADNTCDQSTNAGDLNKLIKSILIILSAVVGAAAVIMIIIGGFRYVTSAGNDAAVTAAKKTITYAIVGLIIVALAQVIVHFVLENIDPSQTTKKTAAGSSSSSSGSSGGSSSGSAGTSSDHGVVNPD